MRGAKDFEEIDQCSTQKTLHAFFFIFPTAAGGATVAGTAFTEKRVQKHVPRAAPELAPQNVHEGSKKVPLPWIQGRRLCRANEENEALPLPQAAQCGAVQKYQKRELELAK